MSVDKFGRHESILNRREIQSPLGEGLRLANHGNYDLNNRLIRNMGDPRKLKDAVTLNYVNNNCLVKRKNGSLEMDAEHFKITNLADGVADTDAVNVRLLKNEIKYEIVEIENKIERLSNSLFKHIHGHQDNKETSNSNLKNTPSTEPKTKSGGEPAI